MERPLLGAKWTSVVRDILARPAAPRMLSATPKRHAHWLANQAETSIQNEAGPFRMKYHEMREVPEPQA